MDVLFENSVQACYVYNHDNDNDDDDNSHDDNNGDGDGIMMDYSDISDDGNGDDDHNLCIISLSHLVLFYHSTAHIGMDLPIHLLEHYRLQFSCAE